MKQNLRNRLDKMNALLEQLQQRRGPARVHKVSIRYGEDKDAAWAEYRKHNPVADGDVQITKIVVGPGDAV